MCEWAIINIIIITIKLWTIYVMHESLTIAMQLIGTTVVKYIINIWKRCLQTSEYVEKVAPVVTSDQLWLKSSWEIIGGFPGSIRRTPAWGPQRCLFRRRICRSSWISGRTPVATRCISDYNIPLSAKHLHSSNIQYHSVNLPSKS